MTSDDEGAEEAPTEGGGEGKKARGLMTVYDHTRGCKRKATIGSYAYGRT